VVPSRLKIDHPEVVLMTSERASGARAVTLVKAASPVTMFLSWK
jgi:hypothetical protein